MVYILCACIEQIIHTRIHTHACPFVYTPTAIRGTIQFASSPRVYVLLCKWVLSRPEKHRHANARVFCFASGAAAVQSDKVLNNYRYREERRLCKLFAVASGVDDSRRKDRSIARTCVCVYVFLYIYDCMRLGTKIIGGKIYEKHFDKHFDDNFDMWLIDKILLNCFHTNDNKMWLISFPIVFIHILVVRGYVYSFAYTG